MARIEVAVSTHGLTALVPGAADPLRVDCAMGPSGADAPGRLPQAFGRLEQAVRDALDLPAEVAGPVFAVRIALLPSLCEVRLVELPPVGPRETDALLRRNAPRYFLGGSRELVISGARVTGGAGNQGPVLVAAAPADLLEALRVSVESRGWRLESITPAHAAWLALLDATFPLAADRPSEEGTRSVRLLVAGERDMAHLVRYEGRSLEGLRRVAVEDTDLLIDAAGTIPGRALVLADQRSFPVAADRLRERGWIVETGGFGSADEAATKGIDRAELELVPTFIAARRARRDRSLATRLLTAAVLLIVIAGALNLWTVSRQLRQVQRERAQLREEVAPVAAVRDSIDRLHLRLDELRALEATARPLTIPLAELAVLLPAESHLLSLRVAGDTAVIDAAGERAGAALAALRGASTLRDVRLEGSIVRDLEGGSTARERFTLSAILDAGAGARHGHGAAGSSKEGLGEEEGSR